MIVAAYIFRPSLGAPSTDSLRQPQAGLLPYQQLVRDAAPVEQRMFRELQEGLLEAERIRAQTGQWPDVTMLEAEGIPPFAPDPDAESRVHMDLRPAGLGDQLPRRAVGFDRSRPGCSSFSSPSRARPPDPAPNDETHHRLPDGTTLHVSIWNIPEAKRRSGFAALRLPQNDGWTNWLVGRMSNSSNAETKNWKLESRLRLLAHFVFQFLVSSF